MQITDAGGQLHASEEESRITLWAPQPLRMLWKIGKSLAPWGNKTRCSALTIFLKNIWKTAFTCVTEQKQETYTSGSLDGTNSCSYFHLMMKAEPAPETPCLYPTHASNTFTNIHAWASCYLNTAHRSRHYLEAWIRVGFLSKLLRRLPHTKSDE
jgi:hypothetical protein